MIRNDCIDTISPRNLTAPRPLTWTGWLRDGTHLAESGLRHAFAILVTWQRRSVQRHHMAELDERILRDINVDRVTLEREARKPFWRP